MKVVVFLKNDLINGQAFNAGDVGGFPDHVVTRLLNHPAGPFVKLYNSGKVQEELRNTKIPGAMDWWSPQQLAEHVEGLEKSGKWKPPPAPVVRDPEIAKAAREKAFNELNQAAF
jgi:hypothetical protein